MPGMFRSSRPAARLRVEQLEERCVPATFTVTNTNATGTGSLAAQIALANGMAGLDTIVFAANVAGTITVNNYLAITDEVIISGPGAGRVTVSGGGTELIFYVNTPANETTTISGLTIANAGIGALYITNGNAVLDSVVVTNNTAAFDGAGVGFNAGTGATLTIRNSIISNNTSTGATSAGAGLVAKAGTVLIQNTTISGNTSGDDGGGLYFAGSTLTIQNSTITGNTSVGGGGGIGTKIGTTANITITNSTISNNRTSGTGAGGGGIDLNGGTLTVQNSTISGNSSAGGGGGGIDADGPVTIQNSTIAGNTTTGDGGGVNFNSSTFVLQNSTVSGNSATGDGRDGGGLYLSGQNATIENSTISGNSSRDDGGGAFISVRNTTINNSTIAFNTAGGGGGGLETNFIGGTFNVTSTIVSNNSAGGGSGDDFRNSNGRLNLVNSLLTTDVSRNGINGTNSANIIGVDPGLGALAMNGGPTATHAIASGSVAIDRGLNPAGLAFDQRGAGFVRTSLGGTDIGAFEVQPIPAGPTQLAYGLGLGAGITATITGGVISSIFIPFPGYTGPVNVATGLLTGNDQIVDRVYAVGVGFAAVLIVDGATNQPAASFFALSLAYNGGISVAIGDTTGDGQNDLIVATASQAPVVVSIDGTQLGNTLPTGEINPLAYRLFINANPGSTLGINVAAFDVNRDGFADILTGSKRGDLGFVRIFSGRTSGLLAEYMPFGMEFAGGLDVSAGDVNGDGLVDIIVGQQSEGRNVMVLRPNGTLQYMFEAYPLGAVLNGTPLDFTGVNVGVADINGDNILDIVTGVETGSNPFVGVFRGTDGAAFFYTLAAPLGFLGGVFVNG